MSVLLAKAGLAEMSVADQRQFELTIFLASSVPFLAYLLGILALWAVAVLRSPRRRRVSVRSLLALMAVLCPGLALLRLVYWPSWWTP